MDDNIKTHNKSRNIGRKILTALAICFAVMILILIGARLYFRIPVSGYYKNSEKGFKIPDINKGFIPQGLAYDERSECFFVTGYMKDKSASPIYIVRKSDGTCIKKLLMRNPDGSEFHGHAGGMTVHGEYLYVAGSSSHCLYVFGYGEAMSLNDGDIITSIGTVDMPDELRVAYVGSDADLLYSGEFFREKGYPTDETHKMTTNAGDYNQALIYAYRFTDDKDSLFGLSPDPVEAYSIPDQVQGMAVKDGRLYLSTSYGTAFSHILVYNKPVSTGTFSVSGISLPLYELDSASLAEDHRFPPMAEEIVFVDGKMYVMSESASNKYIFGKLTSSFWCYATDMDRLK
ncbi:MAG: hypothetical protein J5824_02980 [Lachnospiraceae bacterium]|nr:hypothetical protein [Lachnospiraceae bacterium]